MNDFDPGSMDPAWVTMTDLDGSNPRQVLRVPLREEFVIREVPEEPGLHPGRFDAIVARSDRD